MGPYFWCHKVCHKLFDTVTMKDFDRVKNFVTHFVTPEIRILRILRNKKPSIFVSKFKKREKGKTGSFHKPRCHCLCLLISAYLMLFTAEIVIVLIWHPWKICVSAAKFYLTIVNCSWTTKVCFFSRPLTLNSEIRGCARLLGEPLSFGVKKWYFLKRSGRGSNLGPRASEEDPLSTQLRPTWLQMFAAIGKFFF